MEESGGMNQSNTFGQTHDMRENLREITHRTAGNYKKGLSMSTTMRSAEYQMMKKIIENLGIKI
jgi:hypothetical protein